ncbi:MAG: type III-A CRISPR-associated protein Csm2 [Lewinellaceae bacterium]|nr:type III-A CRISPR-associated protein Csm2 [Lewinellaceae bacterium]
MVAKTGNKSRSRRLKDWIETGIKGDAITYADKLGMKPVDEKFTTSQIRNFYGELKRIRFKGIEESKQKSAFSPSSPQVGIRCQAG